MNVPRISAVALLWLSSLAITAFAASARQAQPAPQPKAPPIIVTGDNIGFRLEGHQGDARTGTWMVRVDGKWVEARSAVRVVPVK